MSDCYDCKHGKDFSAPQGDIFCEIEKKRTNLRYACQSHDSNRKGRILTDTMLEQCELIYSAKKALINKDDRTRLTKLLSLENDLIMASIQMQNCFDSIDTEAV